VLISEATTINAPIENIWNTLRSLESAEKYLPIVTKSCVVGNGVGATRTCDIQMGDQSFQIQETLRNVDESKKSITISIDNAPPPMNGLVLDFALNNDNNLSQIQISAETKNDSDNTQMIQGILKMICDGLKQYHEER
jgi:carbon monoxide dehydrogenase subunit G